MRKTILLFLLAAIALAANGQLADSIARKAALLAARGDVAALRPLYQSAKEQLPPHTRLYCEMALARAEGRDRQLVQAIDSLVGLYPRQVGTDGRLALAEVKAEALRRLGEYAALEEFCREEQAYFKRKRTDKGRLQGLQRLQEKGRRLSMPSSRSQLLALADRDMAFELYPRYARQGGELDPFARLRCGLTVAQAFHREEEALRQADSLLSCYPDSLDWEETFLCLRTATSVLASQGRWKELAELCRREAATGEATAFPLQRYSRWAAALEGRVPTSVERPQADCSVPLSRDWPLLVPVRLNGQAELPFLLDTGQGQTLLSEADARRDGVELLPDTFSIATPAGLISVSPAFAELLEIGGIRMRNLLVYVVHPSADGDALYPRILGCNELMRTGYAQILPGKIRFPHHFAQTLEYRPPNLRVSPERTLRLQAVHGGSPYTFSFDTGCPGNMLPATAFPGLSATPQPFAIEAGGESAVTEATATESRATGHSGMLGVPFLRSFGEVRLNFHDMSARFFLPAPYKPLSVYSYMEQGDFFALERNAQSLGQTCGDKETALLRLLVGSGKNLPDSTAADADRALAAFKPEKDAEGEGILSGYKADALIAAGRYKEAASLLRSAVLRGLYTGQKREQAVRQAKLCDAAAKKGRPAMEHGTSDCLLPFAGTGREIEAGINRKKCPVRLDPSQPACLLSEKTARKMRVHILYKEGTQQWGLIDSLRLGTFVVRNIPCTILPGKEETATLGFSLLRLVPEATFAPEGITLRPAPSAAGTTSLPLRYDSRLAVEAETQNGFLPLRLLSGATNSQQRQPTSPVRLGSMEIPAADFEAREADGLGLGYLEGKAGRVSIDFRNMRLKF